jgi:hypothetical protein
MFRIEMREVNALVHDPTQHAAVQRWLCEGQAVPDLYHIVRATTKQLLPILLVQGGQKPHTWWLSSAELKWQLYLSER